MSFELRIGYFGKTVEKNAVLLRISVRGFTDLFASTSSIEKLLFIYL